MSRLALSSLVLAIAGSAQAGVVGFTGLDVDFLGTHNGRDIYRVYANFSDATGWQFLNVYNHNITSGTMSALHSDAVTLSGGAGAWTGDQTFASGPFDGSLSDSFVTANGLFGLGASADTALDPSFGSNASAIGVNGGWYDSNPGGTSATVSQRLLIMQIALAAGDTGYSADLTVGFKEVGTTTSLAGSGSYTVGFIPAPGAVALLGLAGFTVSRRRR